MVVSPDQRSARRRGDSGRERGRGRVRRRRLVVSLVVSLVVVGVLVGGAVVAAPVVDGAVRDAVQERVARVVAEQTGASGAVDVTVDGEWFVPQALAGRYPSVRVVARGVPTDGPLLEEVVADLRDVTLPLRDVLGGAPQVAVASSTAQARVAYPELNALLQQQDPPLEVGPGSDAGAAASEQLRVTTSAEVLGRELGLSGLVDLQVERGSEDGGQLLAVPASLDTGVGLLDRLSRRVLAGLRDQLAFTVPLGGLPFDQELTGVEVRPDGVVVSTEGGATSLS